MADMAEEEEGKKDLCEEGLGEVADALRTGDPCSNFLGLGRKGKQKKVSWPEIWCCPTASSLDHKGLKRPQRFWASEMSQHLPAPGSTWYSWSSTPSCGGVSRPGRSGDMGTMRPQR